MERRELCREDDQAAHGGLRPLYFYFQQNPYDQCSIPFHV